MEIKKSELEDLRVKLRELKKLDPSHCHGTRGFIPHSLTPEHYQKIEDLEEKIKVLEKET